MKNERMERKIDKENDEGDEERVEVGWRVGEVALTKSHGTSRKDNGVLEDGHLPVPERDRQMEAGDDNQAAVQQSKDDLVGHKAARVEEDPERAGLGHHAGRRVQGVVQPEPNIVPHQDKPVALCIVLLDHREVPHGLRVGSQLGDIRRREDEQRRLRVAGWHRREQRDDVTVVLAVEVPRDKIHQ